MKKYYPIMLDIYEREALVVGGGDIAYRKVCSLLEFGAGVTVISPDINKSLQRLLYENKIIWINKCFEKGDINNAYLIYAATNNHKVNEMVYSEAHKKGILVNVVDVKDQCDFIVPAILKKGDLTIAVSTNGKSPLVSAKVRNELEEIIGDNYEIFLNLMGEFREKVLNEVSSAKTRKKIFKAFVYSDFLKRLLTEDQEIIRKEMDEIINQYKNT